MLELFEVRAVLDATAASSAAQRRSPVDLARLDALPERSRLLDDPREVRRCLNDWHDVVRGAAHNATVVSLLHTIDAQVKAGAPWHPPAVDDTFEATFADHAAVTEAIRAQDAELARVRMLAHHAHGRDTRIRQSVARGLPTD